MTPAEAARVLGVTAGTEWADVRSAYRTQIRSHHPDRAGAASADRAGRIIEAYRTLDRAWNAPSTDGPRDRPPTPTPTPTGGSRATATGSDASTGGSAAGRERPGVTRIDDDTVWLSAPAEETFGWLLDAAHDVGEITYVDRSMPILEVLCTFEGEPATSLLVTLQGRGDGTDAFCTVESIEARPAPPVAAVVDLLELALHRRVAAG